MPHWFHPQGVTWLWHWTEHELPHCKTPKSVANLRSGGSCFNIKTGKGNFKAPQIWVEDEMKTTSGGQRILPQHVWSILERNWEKLIDPVVNPNLSSELSVEACCWMAFWKSLNFPFSINNWDSLIHICVFCIFKEFSNRAFFLLSWIVLREVKFSRRKSAAILVWVNATSTLKSWFSELDLSHSSGH